MTSNVPVIREISYWLRKRLVMTSSSVLLILIYLRSSEFNVSVSFLDQNLHKYRILMSSSAVTLTIVKQNCYVSMVSCVTHPQFHASLILSFMYHTSVLLCITYPQFHVSPIQFHVSSIHGFMYHTSMLSYITYPQFHV